jgi:hypothetical protein
MCYLTSLILLSKFYNLRLLYKALKVHTLFTGCKQRRAEFQFKNLFLCGTNTTNLHHNNQTHRLMERNQNEMLRNVNLFKHVVLS